MGLFLLKETVGERPENKRGTSLLQAASDKQPEYLGIWEKPRYIGGKKPTGNICLIKYFISVERNSQVRKLC